VTLSFDDDTAEFRRADWQRPWSKEVVRPGDTLQAVVPINTTLTISYRRDGLFGRLERRTIVIDGFI
jgi:hypothetical protein